MKKNVSSIDLYNNDLLIAEEGLNLYKRNEILEDLGMTFDLK